MRRLLAMMLGFGLLMDDTAAFADVNSANEAYQNGKYAQAVSEYRRLALSGDAVAQFSLGQAYALGRGVNADPQQALEWYRRAADHMPPLLEAQDAYGLALFQAGKREDAIPYLEKSAARGEPRAQFVLATAYYNGDIVQKDNVRAYALMTRSAASAKIPKAVEALTTMDTYIPLEQREQGLAMAREMQLEAQRQQLAALDPKRAIPVTAAPLRTETVLASSAPEVSYPTEPNEGTSAAPVPSPKPKTHAPKPALIRQAATLPRRGPQAVESAGSGWRVQLGAFADVGKIAALQSSLAAKDASLGALHFYRIKAGAVTRLQAGPLSEHGAEQLCNRLKAHGTGCLTVKG